ncbi:MAG TPA: hypothetical protein VK862_21525 [Afifellaceae bacterium]|nr:hypothetical protein [Afifellaceae bacterium]
MTPLKTLTAGIGAALLTSSMLTGFAAAGPKPVINPKMQVVAPKPVMIKPVRPMIARPHIKVRVNRDPLEKKADQDEGQAEALPRSASRAQGKKGVSAMLPPQRLPKPRPDFEDALKDIRDAIGADGVSGADPGELQVATIPHGSDGPLGDFGLPGQDDDTGKAPGGGQTSGPFGGMPGNDNMWNDPHGAIGSDIPNPAGDNSHSKDAPDTAPGVRVTPGTIAAAMGAVAGKDDKDPSAGKQESSTGGKQFGLADPGSSREYDSDDGSSHIVETYSQEGDDFVIVRTIENDAGTNILIRTMHGDGSRTDYFRFASGWGWTQERDADGQVGPVRYFGVAELRNPDDAGAGGYVPVNCGSVGCNESRKGKPGVRLSDGMVRALTDPEHSAAAPRNGAAPIVTQHDLLSQYDPDFSGGGGPTPIDKPRIQSD